MTGLTEATIRKLNIDQLKAELSKRGLVVQGKKEGLVKRLLETLDGVEEEMEEGKETIEDDCQDSANKTPQKNGNDFEDDCQDSANKTSQKDGNDFEEVEDKAEPQKEEEMEEGKETKDDSQNLVGGTHRKDVNELEEVKDKVEPEKEEDMEEGKETVEDVSQDTVVGTSEKDVNELEEVEDKVEPEEEEDMEEGKETVEDVSQDSVVGTYPTDVNELEEVEDKVEPEKEEEMEEGKETIEDDSQDSAVKTSPTDVNELKTKDEGEDSKAPDSICDAVNLTEQINMSNRPEAGEQERKLFVGGLNKENTDEEALKNYFESYGDIVDCTIMRDQDRVSRGFGFILFEDASSVDKVMSAKKDGKFSLHNYNIEIKRALPKVPGDNVGSSRTSGLNRKIFVGGLAFSATEDDVRSYFEPYGPVNEVELLRDRETGKLRGFAFVTFDEEDSADKCIQRRRHVICKRICEVKRAQTRASLGDKERNHSRPGLDGRDRQPQNNQLPSGGCGLSMAEVNQLIQQAFIMGKQSVQSAAPAPAANNNILMQALMNQQSAPASAPAPVAPAPANSKSDLAQLAQLLQGRGIDANSLAGLLQKDTPAPASKTNGYSTSYPSMPSNDYGYTGKTSQYGPTKDTSKHGYSWKPY